MLKKLRKCMTDFSHSTYFSAIGVKKNKIDLEQYQKEILQQELEYDIEEEEEYDDESSEGEYEGEDDGEEDIDQDD